MAELNSDALVEQAHKTTGIDAFDCDSYRDSDPHGYSERDNDFYVAWDAISRDRSAFQEWMEANVLAA